MSVKVRTIAIPEGSLLSTVAESFVEYEFTGDEVCHFVPEARFEILFQNGFLFLNNSDNQGWKPRPLGFIGGLHSKSYLVKPESNKSTCFGVKLRFGQTNWLIPDALSQFKNGVFDIEDIFGSQASILLEQLLNSPDRKEQFALVENFLRDRIRPMRRKLTCEYEKIIWEDSSVSVEKLARMSNRSCSHFRKLFAEEVGLSPKEYIKIVRAKKAIQSLRNRKYDSLTELSYDLGYFDQSHFIHDFKSVAGVAPGKFLARDYIFQTA